MNGPNNARAIAARVTLGILTIASLGLEGCLGVRGEGNQLSPTPEATRLPISEKYPLAGQSYNGIVNGVADSRYNAVWTDDGRLWEPRLPSGDQRQPFTVGITIEEGQYTFNGVGCDLHLDAERNGQGGQNPVVAGHENGKKFTVDTRDNGQAWGLAECEGGASGGFDVTGGQARK
jgi:hypothetical protein